MNPPRNLDELTATAIPDPRTRALAAAAYIKQREDAINQARGLRDAAIVELLIQGNGLTAVARMCEVSVSHVKTVRSIFADDIKWGRKHR